MSEPEIARRCQTCGASVRGTARFCPQCGQLMSDERDAAAAQTPARAQPPRAKSGLVDEAERVANSLSGRLAAREPEANAPAAAVEDVLSLDPEPAATTHVAERARVAEPVAPARAEESVLQASAPAVEDAPTMEDGARAAVEMAGTGARGTQPDSTDDAPADSAPITGAARAQSAGDGRGAGRVRRATAAVGAGLGETVRPRVEKLRDASVVVFDEAAEDPGVRFVVIAALLFLVALLVLLFSFVLR
jgi:hypothetical protein